VADVGEVVHEASFIVGSSWPDIMKLGTHLQTHREMAFPEISAVLDLKNGRCVYDESICPDTLGTGGYMMCNDFGNNIPYSDYLAAFTQIRAPVVFPTAARNLEPRDDIWPTDTAPVFRRREDGVEQAQLRWGFPPARPKGGPVINFRSEGRCFPKGRCLIPASHFFKFTGSNPPTVILEQSDWLAWLDLTRPEQESLCPLPAGSLRVEQIR
jgi:hypothetical protein